MGVAQLQLGRLLVVRAAESGDAQLRSLACPRCEVAHSLLQDALRINQQLQACMAQEMATLSALVQQHSQGSGSSSGSNSSGSSSSSNRGSYFLGGALQEALRWLQGEQAKLREEGHTYGTRGEQALMLLRSATA